MKKIVIRQLGRGAASLLAAALMLAASSVSGAENDYVYTVTKDDTLIGLSAKLLNSPADWPKVARYNQLRNPNYIVPGADLRVPLRC